MTFAQHSDNFDIFVQVKIFLCVARTFCVFFHDPPQNVPNTLTPLPKLYMQTSHVEFHCFHYFVEDVTSVKKQNVQKCNDEIVLGTRWNRVTLVTVFYITVCCFHFSNACNRLREPSRDILSNHVILTARKIT